MKKVFLMFPLIFCLSACWDYNEPGTQNYVLGVSVDYIDDKFNLCIDTVKITGEPTSLSDTEGVVIKSQGATILDALYDAINKAGKKLYWGHTELIIMSETVASAHLDAVCDVITRSKNVYSNVNLAVAKNVAAAEILTAKTPQGRMVSVHISNIFENEEPSHRFICCELWQLKRNFPYILIPLITMEDYPTVCGSAVIRNGALVGYLSDAETQTFAIVESEATGCKLPDIMIDDVWISTGISDVKRTNKSIYINVTLLSSSAPFDTVDPKNRKKLEDKISAIISDNIATLTNKDFGNPLPHGSYNINVTLESSGLTKR